MPASAGDGITVDGVELPTLSMFIHRDAIQFFWDAGPPWTERHVGAFLALLAQLLDVAPEAALRPDPSYPEPRRLLLGRLFGLHLVLDCEQQELRELRRREVVVADEHERAPAVVQPRPEREAFDVVEREPEVVEVQQQPLVRRVPAQLDRVELIVLPVSGAPTENERSIAISVSSSSGRSPRRR